MARPRATLTHRGFLYAQKHGLSYIGPSDDLNSGRNVSARRMKTAQAWVSGYKAAQNDAREKRRGNPVR